MTGVRGKMKKGSYYQSITLLSFYLLPELDSNQRPID
jgi:hypothetical protein